MTIYSNLALVRSMPENLPLRGFPSPSEIFLGISSICEDLEVKREIGLERVVA
jgi:hypothetical protein